MSEQLVNDLDKESMFWVGAMFSYVMASILAWKNIFVWGFLVIGIGSLIDLFLIPYIKDRRKKKNV